MEYLRCKCTQEKGGGMRTDRTPSEATITNKTRSAGCHFLAASQAGRLAGPVFYVCLFSDVSCLSVFSDICGCLSTCSNRTHRRRCSRSVASWLPATSPRPGWSPRPPAAGGPAGFKLGSTHCNENPIYVFLLWELRRPQSQIPHSCVYERFIDSQDRSTYFPQKNRQVDGRNK